MYIQSHNTKTTGSMKWGLHRIMDGSVYTSC